MRRQYSLDIIRLGAVLLMLFAHTVSYFYIGGNGYVLGLKDWGNIVCFVTFLFVSGTVTYLAYLKDFRKHNLPRNKLLARLGYLLAGYYFLASVVSAEKIFQANKIDLGVVARILSFEYVPGYTEFLLPFVFYSLLVICFPKQVKAIAKSAWLIILVGGGSYLLGEFLYQVADLSGILGKWASLIWGGENLYRFPVLQYLLVWLVGMHWGVIIRDGEEEQAELKRETYLLAILFAVAVGAYASGGSDLVLRRWPPSLPFLAIGLAWVGLQLIFFYKISTVARVIRNIYKRLIWLQFISQKAFMVLIIHTSLITLGVMVGGLKTENIAYLLGGYIVSVAVTLLGVFLFTQLLIVISGKDGRRSYLAIFTLGVTGVLLIGAISLIGENVVIEPGGSKQIKIGEEPIKYWYSETKPFRQQLIIEASQLKSDGTDQWLELEFDHASLVKKKASRTDGNDLQVVLWTGKGYESVQFAVVAPNTDKTKLAFKVSNYVQFPDSGRFENYELYYGDLLASEPRYQSKYPKAADINAEAELLLDDRQTASFKINTSREWYLQGDKLEFSFTLPESVTESERITYYIYPAAGNNQSIPLLAKPLSWEPGRQYKVGVDLKNIKFGIFYVQLQIEVPSTEKTRIDNMSKVFSVGEVRKNGVFLGPKIGFRYSAPVFMTWTIDWEGYDLRQDYMDMMVGLTNKYGMPMTHYFNPRVYTNPAITPERAQYLTNWVKQRGRVGDEVSLHIHMHYDLVAAAGLTPKTDPRWGGREEGHDVLTTAYNYEESKQIYSWAIDKFIENGLGKPQGYRAGGWFLDIENLRALNDLGFVYDTSGSDYKQPYGPNQQLRQWNLSDTAKPYQVSRSNQNGSNPPLMAIWEYPNNGADSTNRDANELIRRLRANLQTDSGYRNEAQVLTYLSHPHWFGTIDNAKMVALFDEAENHKYKNDNGPLIYVTQIEAHKRYTSAI